jgi:hypothetical protein
MVSPRHDVVGWTRGRVLGVTGFATQAQAVAAALRAHRVLVPWLERQGLQPLPPRGEDAMRLVRDDARRCHAFEIVLSEPLSGGMAIHAALITVHGAHGRIGVADVAMRSPKPAFALTFPSEGRCARP